MVLERASPRTAMRTLRVQRQGRPPPDRPSCPTPPPARPRRGSARRPRHGGVVEPRAAIEIDVRDRQILPAGAGGHDHRAGQDVLAVVEVDPREPLGAVGQLDGLVEAREDRVETARLQGGGAGQLGSRDAAGSRGNPRCGCCCPPGRPGPTPPRRGAEALGAGRDRGGQPRRAGAEHDHVEALAVDVCAQAELVGHLGGGGVPQHAVVAHEDGGLLRGSRASRGSCRREGRGRHRGTGAGRGCAPAGRGPRRRAASRARR